MTERLRAEFRMEELGLRFLFLNGLGWDCQGLLFTLKLI